MTEYPKEFRANLEYRAKLLGRCRKDLEYRATVKELFHRDILFAFNTFFYTLDVRRRPFHNLPFCTYGFQDSTLLRICEAIDSGEDLPIEKSRDMGASWMVILTFLWFWLKPEGGGDFLLGSRIEDYVDKKGDMRTLLQKARYAIARLPKWLLPKGYKTSKHDHFMRLINPESGASITGESNNPNFSTGGRYAGILFDEFHKWEGSDKSAWTAAGDASPCRIAVSTPNGSSGQYYELVHSGRPKVTLHWSLHPVKGAGAYSSWPLTEEMDKEKPPIRSPWYDKECLRRSPQEIAQELDIDYLGSGRPVFSGLAAKRLKVLRNNPKSPSSVHRFDFATQKLQKVSEPRDLESHFLVYKEPSPCTSYIISVDVAEGKEDGDYCLVKVLQRETKSFVATYASQIDEVTLANIIQEIYNYYSYEARIATIGEKEFHTTINPWVAVEVNGPGLATFDICAILGITQLFMMPNYDSALSKTTHTKGWRTTSSSRNMLVAGIKEWLLEGKGWVDPRAIGELFSFEYSKTAKPEAKQGAHDDEVMALGIAIQVDQMCPLEEFATTEDLREDGLSSDMFSPKPSVGGASEDSLTLEQRCWQSVSNKRDQLRLGGEEFYYGT